MALDAGKVPILYRGNATEIVRQGSALVWFKLTKKKKSRSYYQLGDHGLSSSVALLVDYKNNAYITNIICGLNRQILKSR